MKLTPAQKKLWHTVAGGLGAAGGYILVNHLPVGQDLKVPLLAVCVGVIVRTAGALLAKIDTESGKPPSGTGSL